MEKRTFKAEMRAKDGDSRGYKGVASVFDTETRIYWFLEKIERGAFDEADTSETVCAVNHNYDLVVSRTSAGNLTVRTTENGFEYEGEASDTTAGRDLMVNLRDGNITQSSFAFVPSKVRWEEEKRGNEIVDIRVIEKIEKVYDVAPVVFPAYPTTTSEAKTKDMQTEDFYREEKRNFKETIEKRDNPERVKEEAPPVINHKQWRERELLIKTKTLSND